MARIATAVCCALLAALTLAATAAASGGSFARPTDSDYRGGLVKRISFRDTLWQQCRGDQTGTWVYGIKTDITCSNQGGNNYGYGRHDDIFQPQSKLGSCEWTYTLLMWAGAPAPRVHDNGVTEWADVLGTCVLSEGAESCLGPLCGNTVLTIQGHAYTVPAYGKRPAAPIVVGPDVLAPLTVPTCCAMNAIFNNSAIFGPQCTAAPGRRLQAADGGAAEDTPVSAAGAAEPQYRGAYRDVGSTDATLYAGTAYMITGNVLINSPHGDVEEVGRIEYVPVVTSWATATTVPANAIYVEPYTANLWLREKASYAA